MTSKGFKYTTNRGALHAFHRFHQVHKSLYLSFSKNSNFMLFSFSFNFWKKNFKKKTDYELLWESRGFCRGSLCWRQPLKLCLQQSTSRSFASSSSSSSSFFFFFFFFLIFLNFLFIYLYVSYLNSLFISTSKNFTEKFPAKYYCIIYLSFNVVNDSRNIWVIHKFKLPLKFCPQNFLA